MRERVYSDAELDAALTAIAEPRRLRDAQDRVARVAPQLQRVLAQALDSGGWFDQAHQTQVAGAAGLADAGERERAVGTLVAEETRLSMLVGVAVGYELAHELQSDPTIEED